MARSSVVVWCAYLAIGTCAFALSASGQGLLADRDKALGASFGSLRRLTEPYIRSLSANITKEFKRIKTQCRPAGARGTPGPVTESSGCALSSPLDEDDKLQYVAALLRAMSPLSYSSADPKWTDGVSIVLPPVDQRPCFTCTACAVAYGASTAVASVLRINANETQISPLDLYYCQGVSRTCTSSSTLLEMLAALASPKQQLIDGSCQPYTADSLMTTDHATLCNSTECGQNRWTSSGSFTYKRLSSQFEIMQHIRAYGAVVSQFDIYQDFKAFFQVTNNRKKIYRPPRQVRDGDYIEGHAVILIGYHLDDNNSSNSYWIAQNSWGSKWADGGRFKVDLEFPGLAGGNTYGIAWQPEGGSYQLPMAIQSLPGLTRNQPFSVMPFSMRCCLYKPRAQDYMSKVASLAGKLESLEKLKEFVQENFALIDDPQNLTLSTRSSALRVCDSPACSNLGLVQDAVSLGCFAEDIGGRALPHKLSGGAGPDLDVETNVDLFTNFFWTPATCAHFAQQGNFSVFGIGVFGSITECWAGVSISRAQVYGSRSHDIDNARCCTPCKADPHASCGGANAFNLYAFPQQGARIAARKAWPLALPRFTKKTDFIGASSEGTGFVLECPTGVITTFFCCGIGDVAFNLSAKCTDGAMLGPLGLVRHTLGMQSCYVANSGRGYTAINGSPAIDTDPSPPRSGVVRSLYLREGHEKLIGRVEKGSNGAVLVSDRVVGETRYRLLQCPPGMLITGLYGRHGDFISYLGIICKRHK